MAIHQSFNFLKTLSLIFIRLLSLILLVCGAIATPLAMAASCQDIFTDPASGNHLNALTVPTGLKSKGNLVCSKKHNCIVADDYDVINYKKFRFNSGDYKFNNGHFSNVSTITTSQSSGATTRLYFDNLKLTNAKINASGSSRNLMIYVSGSLSMSGDSEIKGIVYVAGSAHLTDESRINGGLATGGPLTAATTENVGVQLDEISNADLGQLCQQSLNINQPLHIQYGQVNGITSTVQFEQPFPAGVKPVVFLMPAIDSDNPNNATPAAAFLTQVSSTGFTWVSEVAPYKKNNKKKDKEKDVAPNKKGVPQVSPINWIAVSPGNHILPNGAKLIVGTRGILHQKKARFATEELPSLKSYDVLLSQIQTPASTNCWLTSFSKTVAANPDLAYPLLATEASTATIGKSCEKFYQVGYLAVKSGTGTINLNGHSVRYQFGVGKTAPRLHGKNPTLSQQCQSLTEFKPHFFDSDPIVIAGRESREGGDGGWLRRCELSEDSVSMVIDETRKVDDYQRSHTQETYGYIALQAENKSELSCLPKDTFSRINLGDKWIAKLTPDSTLPHIVDGSLLITEDIRQQAASVTYKHLFPADGNFIRVAFDYYAWSSSYGKGADGMALVFSDADVPPSPGGYGASLGYAHIEDQYHNHKGFNGGWLGIGFDEYGNFSAPSWGRDGADSPPESIGVRGSEVTNYGFIYNSKQLSPPLDMRSTLVPGPGDQYIVSLDLRQPKRTYLTVERSIKKTGQHELIIDRLDITAKLPQQQNRPKNFYISLTGSTGASTNTHEIDNFQVCSIDAKPIGEQVDHFEFDYSGSPLSCAPLAVTIKACKNAACSELFDAPVKAVLKTTTNNNATWLDAQLQPLVNQTINIRNGQAKLYLQQFSSGQLTELEVAHSVPSAVPYSQTVCKNNDRIGSCKLRFAEAGFVISDVTTFANKPAKFMVKAVRKADNRLQCVPTFGGQTKSLNFGVDYITPRFKAKPQNLLLSQTGAQYIQINTAAYLPVKFNNMGIAHFTMKYADAGKLSLLVNYRGSDKTHDAGLVMNSTNGNIYSVPFGFCVKPSDKNAVCKNNPALCDVYKRTGDEFPLAVSARAWSSAPDADICDNIVTPSFAMDNILLRHSLLAPTVRDGGVLGELGTTSINMQQGLSTKVNQTVSEVGVFDFSTQTASHQTYLNAGLPIKAGVTQAIGRFVPSMFKVTDYSLTPACSSSLDKPFSYMEQPFYTRFLVKALNQHSDVTRNYFAGFAKASAGWAADDYLVGHELGNRVDELPTLNWQRGIAEIDSHTIFHRLQKPKPDGPYTEWELGVALNDNDGGYTKLIDTDMNSAHAGDCGTNGVTCTAKRLGMQQMLFGRVVMDNVYGPETTTLRMPITAQYWNGHHWQINQLDSCTVIDNTHLLGDGDDLYSPAIVAGQSVTREGSPGLSHFQQGKFELLWQDQLNDALPVDKQYYHGEIIAPLAVPDYLKYYWQWETGIPVINSNPRASADFGLYRGNDRIIYWKEVY